MKGLSYLYLNTVEVVIISAFIQFNFIYSTPIKCQILTVRSSVGMGVKNQSEMLFILDLSVTPRTKDSMLSISIDTLSIYIM